MIQDQQSLHCALVWEFIEINLSIYPGQLFFDHISVIYLPFWLFVCDFDANFHFDVNFALLADQLFFSSICLQFD